MGGISTASFARLVLALVVLGAPLHAQAAPGAASGTRHIAGTYSDEQLASITSLTLPRVFLYDRHGALIPQDHWPQELQGLKPRAGDAFCCVSDKPAAPGSSGPGPLARRRR